MDIGAVLTKAWNITWKYKVLWVLGVLAGCSASGRGSFGQSGGNFRGWNLGQGPEFQGPPIDGQPPAGMQEFLDQLGGPELIPIIAGVILLVLAISLVVLVLGVLGQGGLIAAFGRADDGFNITLGEAFRLGGQHFWRLLGIRIMVWVVGAVVAIAGILAAGLFIIGTFGIGALCLIPVICLLIPLGIAIDAYIVLTMVTAVEENVGVFESFGKAWQFTQKQLGSVAIMTLILVVGGAIVSAILFLPFAAIVIPAVVGGLIGEDTAFVSGLAISGLCLVLALPVLLGLSGVLTTFITGVWTLTYRRLSGKPGVAELGSAAAAA